MSDSVRFGILRKFYDAERTGASLTVDLEEWAKSFRVSKPEVVFELRYLVDKTWIGGEYVGGSEVPVLTGITAEGKDAFEQYLEQTKKNNQQGTHLVEKEMATVPAPIEIHESLDTFKKDHPDSSKVGFIMMRFGKTSAHDRIKQTIRGALTLRGLEGVRSDDKQYHDDLYSNVLTYAHGCGFGVAVFERIEAKEFNPNVTLEVGYMLALHKPVCLLKDKTLRKLPADLLGKLYKEFDLQDPERTISTELSKWLIDKNLGESVYKLVRPSDFAQKMMFVRYEIEIQLRRLWETRHGSSPKPFMIRHVIRQLTDEGILEESLANTTLEVYVICSHVVHGDQISETQNNFVRDRESSLIATLKELSTI